MPTLDEREKASFVEELREYLRDEQSQAERLLEESAYDLLSAMELLAREHGATQLSDSDWETCLQDEVADVSHAMYASSYGRVVKIMKRIETLGEATTIQLPQIVVIGSESSGKSSTLERIAGFSFFPRDGKICTRMPIMLRLINVGNIPQPAAVDKQAAVLLKFPGREDVTVSEAGAADAVGALMASVVPPGRGIIYEQLTIEVRKASVPTLDLVDLPGIVAASIAGEPADMMSRTRELTNRYLQGSNTIVVAVVPANITRVRDSQAVQLVQASGKQHLTLGVLAKSDLAHDPRFKQHKKSSPYWELEQRLAGDADDMIVFPNGWVAVKNRDTQIEEEEAGGLMESLQVEREWFATETNISAGMQKEQCGIDALLRNINGLFTKHISQTWAPQAIEHLEQEMHSIASQIFEFGPLPATLSLQQVLAEFTSKFNDEHKSSGLSYSILQHLTFAVSAATKSVTQLPTRESVNLLQLLAKDETEAAIKTAVSSAEFLHLCVADPTGAAVRLAFEQPSPSRLKRFELLCTVVTEVSSALIIEQAEKFSQAMDAAVTDHFAAFCGFQYDKHGSSNIANVDLSARSEQVLLHVLTEVALRTVVLPLQLHSPRLLDTLSQSLLKSEAAASIFSGKEPPCLNEPDAAAKLLVESCKAERAKLAKRRYDLYKSLTEVEEL